MDDDAILPYKGQTTVDAGAFYAPFIPLRTVGIIRVNSRWIKYSATDSKTGWAVYMVDDDVEAWITTQPYHMWNIYEPTDRFEYPTKCNLYSLSPEVESWFLLRWS